jgi:hypothetical protein
VSGDEREVRLCLSCGLSFPTLRAYDRRFCWRCAPTVPGEREAREAYAVGQRKGVEATVRLFWQTQLRIEADQLEALARALDRQAAREGLRDARDLLQEGGWWQVRVPARRCFRRGVVRPHGSHASWSRGEARQYRADAAEKRRWAEGF